MCDYQIGERFIIHSYKHDGSIHRSWDEAVLLDKTEEYMVFANYRTKVIESDGRVWKTKEPAIMVFFKKKWYNVIGQIKKEGIFYYCNIASPFVIEEKTIKYIDYDLDLRIFPDGAFKILDRGEYRYHKNLMNYSNELDKILKNELSELIDKVRSKDFPFNVNVINSYYGKYESIKKEITD